MACAAHPTAPLHVATFAALRDVWGVMWLVRLLFVLAVPALRVEALILDTFSSATIERARGRRRPNS